MAKPEFKIQAEGVVYLRLHHPNLLLAVSPMVGTRMTPGMAMKMVRMGYQSGTPDIIILKPMAHYHGILIEIKAPGGSVSPEQTAYLGKANTEGYKTAVVWSYKELIDTVENYLQLPF